MKGGSKVIVVPHKHDGVFIAKAKEDALCTKNRVAGVGVKTGGSRVGGLQLCF